MKIVKRIVFSVIICIVTFLTVYDTHTDLIIDCEEKHGKCKLIAVPVNGGK